MTDIINPIKDTIDYAKKRLEEIQKDLDQIMANYNALVGRQAEAKLFLEFAEESMKNNVANPEAIEGEFITADKPHKLKDISKKS